MRPALESITAQNPLGTDWIRLRITLRWDGQPLLFECLKQLKFNLARTRLSNSFQVCLFECKSGDMEDQGETLDIVVVEELCGVAC